MFDASLPHRLVDFIFKDRLRILELISAFNLLQWAKLLYWSPELVKRDTYIGFSHLGAGFWSTIMLIAALFHLVPMFVRTAHDLRLRMMAFLLSGGVWLTTAANFIQSGINTTADWNYISLSFFCLLSGVYLAWTKS